MANDVSLPKGWKLTTLGEATQPAQKRVNPQDFPDLPYIGMENVEAQTMRLLGTVSAKEMKSTADSFNAGDVLYGRLRPYLNKVLCPDFDGLCSTEFIVFRKVPTIFSKYLQYFLNSWDFVRFANSLNAGDRPRVKFEQLANYPFPIPPIDEQERIVAKIEEMFTQLEAGTAALRRVQAGFKRYKASVLNAACEGRLVEQDPGDEPAEEMLHRLGKKPIERDDLSELPQGWCWGTIKDIGEVSGGLTKNSKRNTLNLKLPYLRVANVYANELRLNEVFEIGVVEREIQRALLQKGDLLVVEGNGSADQIGRVAIWNGSISPCLHQNHIIKVSFEPVEIGRYVLYWFLSKRGREQINRVASSTSGLYTLSLSKVSNLLVPLPPLQEQRRIVAEVERPLSVVTEVEVAVECGLKRAERLRQAILKKAFEGRLV
jgi:type I restriction enzyme, S subunit